MFSPNWVIVGREQNKSVENEQFPLFEVLQQEQFSGIFTFTSSALVKFSCADEFLKKVKRSSWIFHFCRENLLFILRQRFSSHSSSKVFRLLLSQSFVNPLAPFGVIRAAVWVIFPSRSCCISHYPLELGIRLMMPDGIYVIVAFNLMASGVRKVSQRLRRRHIVAQHHIRADKVSCLCGSSEGEERGEFIFSFILTTFPLLARQTYPCDSSHVCNELR
jgi:hypothetical protein